MQEDLDDRSNDLRIARLILERIFVRRRGISISPHALDGAIRLFADFLLPSFKKLSFIFKQASKSLAADHLEFIDYIDRCLTRDNFGSLDRAIDQFFLVTFTLMERYCDDCDINVRRVRKEYPCEQLSDSDFSFYLSDPHCGNFGTVRANLKETAIFLKPRNGDIDLAAVRAITNLQGNLHNVPIEISPTITLRNGYHFSTEIKEGFGSTVVWEDTFEQLGTLTFFAYILNATDLHFENVVMSDRLTPIDLETFFGAPSPELNLQAPIRKDYITTSLVDNVIRTSILPQLAIDNEGGYFDISLVTSLLKRHVDNSNYSRERAAIIAAGSFSRAYEHFLHHRKQVEEIFSDCVDARTSSRFILRSTRSYANLLQAITSPSLLVEPEKRGEFLNNRLSKFLRQSGLDADAVVRAEIDALQNFSIPIFHTKPLSKSLYVGDREISSFFLRQPPLETLKGRLNALRTEDLKHQAEIIFRGIADSFSPTEVRRPALVEHSVPGPSALRSAYRRSDPLLLIAREIDSGCISDSQGKLGWMGVTVSNAEGLPRFGGTGLGLYHGAAGISLFGTVLRTCNCAGDHPIRLEKCLYEHFNNSDLTDLLIGISQSGLSSGTSGILYAVSKSLELAPCPKKAAILSKLAMTALNEDAIYNGHESDLLEGRSGAILALCKCYTVLGDNEYVRSARQIAASVMEFLALGSSDPREVCPGGRQALRGFAHGMTGVGVAFSQLFAMTGEEKWREAAMTSFQIEDRSFEWAQQNWAQGVQGSGLASRIYFSQWCSGSVGILGGRSLASMALQVPLHVLLPSGVDCFEMFKRATNVDWRMPDFVCCGISGVAITAFMVGTITKDERMFSFYRRICCEIKAHLIEDPYICAHENSSSVLNYGLFRGLAGIGLMFACSQLSEMAALKTAECIYFS